MTIPNKITLIRILLIPVNVIFFIYEKYIFFLVFIFISFLTDALDGFIARTRNQRSELGTFLDPLADKILLNSMFFIFSLKGIIPWWATIIVTSRDLIISLGWLIEYILSKVSIIKPSVFGKMTTFFQMAVIFLAFIQNKEIFIFDEKNIYISIIVMTVFTLISGIDYVISGVKRLS